MNHKLEVEERRSLASHYTLTTSLRDPYLPFRGGELARGGEGTGEAPIQRPYHGRSLTGL